MVDLKPVTIGLNAFIKGGKQLDRTAQQNIDNKMPYGIVSSPFVVLSDNDSFNEGAL